jgi:hypothetical protein
MRLFGLLPSEPPRLGIYYVPDLPVRRPFQAFSTMFRRSYSRMFREAAISLSGKPASLMHVKPYFWPCYELASPEKGGSGVRKLGRRCYPLSLAYYTGAAARGR